MEQLQGQDYELESVSFLSQLAETYHTNGNPYIQIHRDVAQALINENVGLEGANRVLEENILEFENQVTTLKGDLAILRIENICHRKGIPKWLTNLKRLRLHFKARLKSRNQSQETALKSLSVMHN